MNDIFYLDYAAATPIDERVVAAMMPYFSDKFFNPSSPYLPAVIVRQEFEAAKDEIARHIGAKSSDIIMTAGATESINLAIGGSMQPGDHIISSEIEHDAVLACVKTYPTENVTLLAPEKNGMISLDKIAAAIRPNTKLISIALANNELGTVQKMRKIAEIIEIERQRRRELGSTRPLFLHSDASQGLGLLDSNVARMGVDLLTLNAAKVYGPKQVGLLWTDSKVRLNAQINGGGQERGLRSGTENVAGVVGFAMALRLAEKNRKNENYRLKELRDMLQKKLQSAFPESLVSGSQKSRLPNFLHISFEHIDAERLLFSLENRGVLLATGSACAANKGTRSHVLTAIGLPDSFADGSVRISLGKFCDEKMLARATEIIVEEVQKEYARTAKKMGVK